MSATGIAIISSDWNECLSPCRPFDFLSYLFPQMEPDLDDIFLHYTANRITLGEAAARVRNFMPAPVTAEQIDAYLKESFRTYTGVPELIEWCLGKNIVFMINTTGMIGYFQRIFANKLLPRLPAISAHPLIRFPEQESDPPFIYDLHETRDKGPNTAKAFRSMEIPAGKVIILGDSGGDGPHFKWGSENGALLIGSMTKPSLDQYCQQNDIFINLRFGRDYSRDGKHDRQMQRPTNFMDLTAAIEAFIE